MKVKQSIPKHLRFTLQQFADKFPNDDACLEYLKEKRYPSGITYCAKCQQERKHHRVTGRSAYACDYCGSMISPMAGTIFEHSSTPLRAWFYAMYLMGSTRCEISAKQVQRETCVTYKTAWRMFKQIRSLMSDGELELEGPTVEVDEMYYGGKRKGVHGRPMRGDKNKTPVVGIVQRKGRAVVRVTRDVRGKTVMQLIRNHVVPGSAIYTDESSIYDRVGRMQARDGKLAKFDHRRILHASGNYVNGDIHTNSVEGFWRLVKRGIGGVYHSVSPQYLQSYLGVYTFRYNGQNEGNQQFNAILERGCERAS